MGMATTRKALVKTLSQPMRAAIYTRISDARDGESAGVDRQQEDCEARCEREDWNVVGIYCDNNVSAYKPKGKQPSYLRMLADIANGEIDVIVCNATDRLYRQLKDLEDLIEALGDVHVATIVSGEVDLSTADGRLHARILGSVAQHESDKKAERVSRAYLARATEGGWSGGGRRFGYNSDCTELVEVKADALRAAYMHVAKGGSLESVVRQWNELGLVGPKGGKLVSVQVRSFLLRPRNAGIAVYHGDEVGTATSPVIIDEDTFRTVRANLLDPSRRATTGPSPKTMLARVLRCGVCRARVSGAARQDVHHGKLRKVITYGCRKSHVVRNCFRMDEALGNMTVEYVIERSEQLSRPIAASTRANSTAVEAERLRGSLEDLAEQMANGDLTAADFASVTTKIRARLSAINVRAAKTARRPATSTLIASGDIAGEWAKAENSELRRTVVNELVDSVVLTPVGRRTGAGFTTAGIDVVWRTLS